MRIEVGLSYRKNIVMNEMQTTSRKLFVCLADIQNIMIVGTQTKAEVDC